MKILIFVLILLFLFGCAAQRKPVSHVKTKDDNVDTYIERADKYFKNGNPDLCIDELKKTINKYPDPEKGWEIYVLFDKAINTKIKEQKLERKMPEKAEKAFMEFLEQIEIISEENDTKLNLILWDK